MYDRQDRDALYRDDRRQSPPMLRYGSPPTSSHRSSPSASRRPSPPQQPAGQQAEPAPQHPSNPRMSHRDSAGDQGQVAQTDAPPQQPPAAPSAAVPTGPRRGYGQAPPYGASAIQQQSAPVPVPNRAPPTGPRASLEGGGSGMQGRTYDRSPYGEGSSGQMQQQQAPFRREGFGRESTSHLQFPTQSSGPAGGAPASSSGPTTPVVPLTPASASRRSTWTDAETRGSVEEKARAEPDPWPHFDVSLERIRSAQTTFAHPTMVALRKALSDLANSDVELAGARFKTSVTEAALEKAKEEAEAWSIETARIELEQRNGGLDSFWHTPTSSIPTPAP